MKKRLINIHIPKTAGSSFRRIMRKVMVQNYPKNFAFVGVDKTAAEYQQFKHLPSYEDISQHAAFRFPELFRGDIGFMSGHYRYQDIASLIESAREEVSVITFLRQPVMRTVSDYFYCCSPKHPTNEEFQARYPSIEPFVLKNREINRQYEFLKPNTNASVAETVENAREQLDFIGRTESFQADADDLFAQLDIHDVPHIFSNKNQFSDKVAQTFESHYDFIADHVQKDIELYEALTKDQRTILPE